MGLNQYAYEVPPMESNTNDYFDSTIGPQLIGRWRSHSTLHGWMETIWYSHRPPAEVGDGTLMPRAMRLTFADLDRLDEVAADERDLKFLETAHRAMTGGFDVYYTSWM